MADADYDYNVAEQKELEAKVARIRRKPGMPKDVRQLLDKRYIAAARTQQHNHNPLPDSLPCGMSSQRMAGTSAAWDLGRN